MVWCGVGCPVAVGAHGRDVMNVPEGRYMFACFREEGSEQRRGVGAREKGIRHVLRIEKRRWGGGSGAFRCFSGSGVDADGSLGLAGDSEGGSMVPRQSQVSKRC